MAFFIHENNKNDKKPGSKKDISFEQLCKSLEQEGFELKDG